MRTLLSESESGPRVLCVEDNPLFQRMLKISLEAYGLEVITASHGLDGLMQYKAHQGKFIAIISDKDMPQMNGLTFVQTVREMGYQGRIVVMSGNLQLEELRQFDALAVTGYFNKPFDVSMLAAMLIKSDS